MTMKNIYKLKKKVSDLFNADEKSYCQISA